MLNLRFKGNRRKLWQFAAALSFLLFVSLTSAQAQTTTFATFSQRFSSNPDFVFTNSGASGTFNTVSGGTLVRFFYDETVITGLPLELQNQQNAILTLTSNTNAPATTNAGNITQPINGSFTLSIIRTTAATVGGGMRTNLLTVTVAPATSTGDIFGSGNSATYQASDAGAVPPRGQVVTFTSDFLDFTQTTARNTALNFTGLNPTLAINPVPPGAGLVNSFTASGGGSFASNPPPFFNPPTAASVNIGGRILTADGRGVSKARVNLTDANGLTRTVTSNSFGYYHFDGIDAGQTVVVSVSSKRYTFAPQVVSVANELTDLNFTAQ